MKIKLDKITKQGKALFLAYDHGLEHGPESDFNSKIKQTIRKHSILFSV